jgi:YceI-like protein
MRPKLQMAFLIIVLLLARVTINITCAQYPSAFAGWIVEKESGLTVKGKSNINTFTCNIDKYLAKDTIVQVNNASNAILLDGSLSMDIKSFDCHSGQITNDLRKTLKAKEHPTMVIRFISIDRLPKPVQTEFIKGLIEVELAGVVKRFDLVYTFSKEKSGNTRLIGGRSFCFSDFNLSPPKKLAGLIKIKDDFEVEFKLTLRSM